MSHPITAWSSSLTALEVRGRLIELEAERGLALREGLGSVTAYMAHLEAELQDRRGLYAILVVTEIATLRAELFGPQTG